MMMMRYYNYRVVQPLEDEAVVCGLLDMFPGHLRLVELPANQLEGLKYRPGHYYIAHHLLSLIRLISNV